MERKEFDRLTKSIRQMKLIRSGKILPARIHHIDPLEVRTTRGKLHLSQREFACLLGISDATLKNWEQGRVQPDGPARVLLRIASKRPDAVLEALHAAAG